MKQYSDSLGDRIPTGETYLLNKKRVNYGDHVVSIRLLVFNQRFE